MYINHENRKSSPENIYIKMAIVVLKLKDKTIPELVEFARKIVTAMTGNPNFPLPSPTLATISTGATALENAYVAALNRDTEKKAIMRKSRNELEKLLTQEGDYVQSASAGDDLKILSAGMDVKAPPQPVGILPAPQNLVAKDVGNEGELELRWKKVNKSTGYLIQMSKDDTSPVKWEFLAITTAAKFIAKELPSGELRYFRVSATNTNGNGSWSDVAKKRVP
jgi:hypothetical protein